MKIFGFEIHRIKRKSRLDIIEERVKLLESNQLQMAQQTAKIVDMVTELGNR